MDLMDFVRAVLKRKMMVVAGVAGCTALAVLAALGLPDQYQAEAMLMVEQSIIPSARDAGGMAPRMIESAGSTYQRIVKSKETLSDAVEEFGLGESPHEFTWETLRRKVSAAAVRGSRLISVKITLQDPELARDLANYVAEKAVEKATELGTTGAEKSQEILQQKLDGARQRLKGARSSLETFRKQARLPILRGRINVLLDRKGQLERWIADARGDIQEKQETLGQVEAALAQQERTIDLRRHLAHDPVYQQLLARLAEEEESDLLKLSLVTQVQNPTFIHLQKQVVDLRAAIEGLKAKMESLREELENNVTELNAAQEQLVTKELDLEKKKHEYQLKNSIYQGLSRKLDEVSLQIASRTQDLKLVDRALLPHGPSEPNRKEIVLGTGFLASFFFVVLAGFLEFLALQGGRVGGGQTDGKQNAG
jgi:uncharacterized protein involved in exopolysaccharide biosynthesis